MNGDELLRIELPSLRDEMLEVKKCQHHVLIFEIMATGAIIGFLLPYISTILLRIHFWPVLFFLSPLIILIPCQYIIIDKAITINRICSYFLVIEGRIAKKTPIKDNFFGWETACAEFRTRNNQLISAGSLSATQGPNHFYKLTFFITAFFTFILLLLMTLFYASFTEAAGASSTEIAIMVGLSIAIIIALVDQFIKLWRVLEGRFTIVAMAQLWEKIV